MPGVHTNAEAKSRDLADICKFDTKTQDYIRRMIEQLQLSARAYDRVLRVSRTIADLEGADTVTFKHVSEAMGYRQLDDDGQRFWI